MIKKIFLLMAIVLGVFVFGLKNAAPVHAADNALVDMTLLDTNANGKIDRVRVRVDNDSAVTSASKTTAGWTAADGGAAVTVSAVSISGAANADPIVINVDLSEADTDLTTDTLNANLELVYTQQGADAGFEYNDGANTQLVAIATGDGSAPLTESDGAAPVIRTFTYQDDDQDGKIDQFQVLFSETVTAASVFGANDLLLTSAGDFTGAAFGSNATDLITSNVVSVNVALAVEATVEDTASTGLAISVQNAFSLTEGTNTNNTLGAQTQADFADGAKPYIRSITIQDGAPVDGIVNQISIVFSEVLINIAAGAYGIEVSSAANHGAGGNAACTGESIDPDGASSTLALTANCTLAYLAVGDLNVNYPDNEVGPGDSSGNLVAGKLFTVSSTPAILSGFNIGGSSARRTDSKCNAAASPGAAVLSGGTTGRRTDGSYSVEIQWSNPGGASGASREYDVFRGVGGVKSLDEMGRIETIGGEKTSYADPSGSLKPQQKYAYALRVWEATVQDCPKKSADSNILDVFITAVDLPLPPAPPVSELELAPSAQPGVTEPKTEKQKQKEKKADPKEALQRGELLKLIVEARFDSKTIRAALDGYRKKGHATVDFSDVPIDSPYAPYIRLGVEKGIIKSYSKMKFNLKAKVSRAEALEMLLKAFGIEVYAEVTERPFDDVSVRNEHAPAIKKAKELGLLGGQTKRFQPNARIKRGAMSDMIKALIKTTTD